MTNSNSYTFLSDVEKIHIIQTEYINNSKSFADIAQEYGTYANRIRRDAMKFNIPIRDKSSAQKNALQTGKHKHPTKGTTRSEETKDKIGMSVMNSWENMSDAELRRRSELAKLNWDKLPPDVKQNRLHEANLAVRESSRTGSKLEKYLLEGLMNNGYKVEFHKEQILSNTKLQIDLFLPEANIAIEVDGPSHFEPVWGEQVLKRNQKYDNTKTGLIIGRKMNLIRIKQEKDFSKSRATLILERLMKAIETIKAGTNNYLEIGDE